MISKTLDEEAIFQVARQMSEPVARQQYLSQACGDDAVLLHRLEALLEVHDRDQSFLKPPPADPALTHDDPLTERPGTVIGPYKLLEQIGEGGFGVVFMAEQQEPVRRKVALKILKAGMDTRQVIARFEAERQALALMDHPNIARVFDGGTTESSRQTPSAAADGSRQTPSAAAEPAADGTRSVPATLGRPYFVMELVKGIAITDYSDKCQLNMRERLELFLSVCQAVQHAHMKGIIHRDIKPSNVLVAIQDGKPIVKVIDFGVAKAINQRLSEHTLLTGFHQMVGTPLYMSPEQAEMSPLDVDTRTDIYSLGVLLYQLLTGTTPFEKERLSKATFDELRRIIREEEPPRPSARLSTLQDKLTTVATQRRTDARQLKRSVQGELDWIAMKALEKDRNRRYETANAFAADVQRYLNDEPVEACPPSVGYRLRKFARKHRAALASAALFIVLLVAGLSVSLWQMFRAIAAEGQANQNAQQARDERDAKDAALIREKEARHQMYAALRSMTKDVVERKFAKGTVLTDDDRAFLRGIIAQYDAFAAVRGDDADSRALRAEGRYRVGFMRYRLGELKKAETDYDQALNLYKQLAADFPLRPEFRSSMAWTHNYRGMLMEDTGRLHEAEKEYDQALRIYKQLAADFPSRPDFRHHLAGEHNNRGIVLRVTGRLKEAEKDYDQALGIEEQLAADFPDRPNFRLFLANIHTSRAGLLSATGRLTEAKEGYDRALSIYKQLAADFPNSPDVRVALAHIHSFRGGLLSATGRLTEAEQDYDQALSIARQLAADFPLRPQYSQSVASSHGNRGNLLSDTSRLKEAEKDFDQALRIYKQLVADFPDRLSFRQELAGSHNKRGNLLRATRRPKEAEKDYDQALKIYKQLAADFPNRPEFREELAGGRSNRGLLLGEMGRRKEAEKDVDQAVKISKQLAADFPNRLDFRRLLGISYTGRGTLRRAAGRPKEAERDFDQALSIYNQLAVDFPSQPDLRNSLAGAYGNLANLQLQQGNWAAAKRLLLKAQPHHLAALKANPRNPTYRRFYRNHLDALTIAHAGLLEREDAVRTAETRRNLGWNAPADAYDAARFLSECIRAVARHDKLDEKQRKEAVQFYGDGAMKLLREAVSKGYKNVAHMKKDRDLAALRPREDFGKLVAEQDLARSYLNRGLLLRTTGRYKEAEQAYGQALSIYKQLVADFPNRPDFRKALAITHNNRGNLLRATRRLKEAEKDFDQALNIYKHLAIDFPSRPDFRKGLAHFHSNRGLLRSDTGRLKEAEQDYDQAVNISEQLAAEFPNRSEFRLPLAHSYTNRGLLRSDTGRLKEAEQDLDQALKIDKQLVTELPNQPDRQNSLAGSCVNLAELYMQQKNWAAAKRLLLEGRPHHLAALKANPRNPTYRQFYRNHLDALTFVHAVLLERDDAVRTAETRRDLGWNPPADAYDATCFLSQCIRAVDKHDKLDDKQRKEAVQFYGDAAMKLLRDAVSKGYKGVVPIKKDRRLAPLHQRQDFQKLVAELHPQGRAQAAYHRRLSRLAIDCAAHGRAADALRVINVLLAESGRPGGNLHADSQTINLCVQHFRRLQNLAACRAATAALEKKNPSDSGSLYNTACCRALTAVAQRQAGGADAARLAKEEADRAMACLTKAVAAGFTGVTLLSRDADLALLRDREDFRKLKAELIAKTPPLAQARYYIRQSQWNKAAAAYAKANLAARPLRDDAFAYACLFLIREDREGYSRFCQGMIQRVARTKAANEIYVLARSCAIARKGPVDPARAVQWAKQSAASTHNPWDYHVLGLAQYRAGQFDQALQNFAKANVNTWSNSQLNWFGLALVHHRLVHPKEAMQCLDKGIQWLKQVQLPPQDWLEAQLLRREAEEWIEGKALPADPWLRLVRAGEFIQIGQFQKAEAELQAAVDLRPKDAGLWIARGRFYAERGEHKKADADFARAAKLTPDELNRFVQAGWWVTGPYPEDLKLPCPPEKNPDPSRPLAAVGSGTELRWRPARTEPDGRVNLRMIFDADHISAYAMTYVYSPDERTATLMVGGDEKVRVWLNGRLVHQTNRILNWSWGLDKVPVTLKAGRNTLLCKISRNTGPHDLILRIADNPFDRGLLHAQLGMWNEAAAEFTRGFDRHPVDDPEFSVRSGHAQLVVGNTAGYRRQLARMLECYDKKQVPVAWLLYLAVLREGTIKATRLEKMAQAVERHPNRGKRPWLSQVAGLGHYRAGQFKRAIKLLEETLKDPRWRNGPGHASELGIALAHYRLGHAKEARQWLDKAEQWYEKAVQRALASPTATANLYFWADWPAFVVLRREAHKQVLGKDLPDDPRLKKLAGRTRDWLKRRDKATRDFDVAIFLKRIDPRLRLLRARRLAELKHHKEAETDLARAVKLRPNDPQVWAEAGRICAAHGQPDRAAEYFARQREAEKRLKVVPPMSK